MDAFWATLFGSAIGVIAGVSVQYIFQKVFDYFRDERIRNGIAKEANFNLLVLADVRNCFARARNAFNANAIANFIPHIPLNRALHLQTNNLASNGRLYEFFDNDQLSRLQKVTEIMSAGSAQWYINELNRRKEELLADPENYDREKIASLLFFADEQCALLEASLTSLAKDFSN